MSEVLAWVGAVTGVLGFVLSSGHILWQVWRDRSGLVVEHPSVSFTNQLAWTSDGVQPDYMWCIDITIHNRSKRSTSIHTVTLRICPSDSRNNLIVLHGFFDKPIHIRGDSTQVLTKAWAVRTNDTRDIRNERLRKLEVTKRQNIVVEFHVDHTFGHATSSVNVGTDTLFRKPKIKHQYF